jgi:hypothetical protein
VSGSPDKLRTGVQDDETFLQFCNSLRRAGGHGLPITYHRSLITHLFHPSGVGRGRGFVGDRKRFCLPGLVFMLLSDILSTMHATAVVGGKVVRFKLSPALARAHRVNRGKTLTEQEAVSFVEAKRREHALRRAEPYLESRP